MVRIAGRAAAAAGPKQRGGKVRRVVPIHPPHRPAIGRKALQRVVGEGQRRVAVDGDAVVVVQDGQLVELQRPGEAGGFKEVVFSVSGENVYQQLRYESGGHRVQRVPVTESSGRIHTSAVAVNVLPEAEEVDVDVDPQDLKIDVYRSSGPGGAARPR